MPTYTVTGEHMDTGDPVHETFRAKDEHDAKRYCSQQRWGIVSLRPVSNGRVDVTPPSMGPQPDLDMVVLARHLEAMRAELRTHTQLLDKTFNEPKSPFFTYLERRTRMAVGVGLVIGAVIFGLIGVVFAVALGG